jgi:hypothetical protein
MFRLKGVTATVLLSCAGALVACDGSTGTGGPAGTGTPSGPAASTAPATPTMAPPSTRAPSAPAGATAAVLSGKREVTIVRQGSESRLSMDIGELVEVDDDSGRQLFVPTPLGANTFLIKAYGTPNNHPANDEPSCWQVYIPDSTDSLTVEGAVCDAANPGQRFTITAKGNGAYAISYESAFLQHSSSTGRLILEELGDAPLLSTFRFTDNGPARRPAGG